MKRLIEVVMTFSAILIFGCLKAGDGVGLTQSGTTIKIDSCKVNPALAGCAVVESCKTNPALAGCAVVDSCKLPNALKRCLDCTKSPMPVACLDKTYFTANVLPIFKNRCESCHNKAGGVGYNFTKLTLETADAWDSLVNVTAFEMLQYKKTTMMRVKPGMPDSSYLYLKVTKDQPAYGQMMPADGSAPLSDAEILIIKNWILGKN